MNCMTCRGACCEEMHLPDSGERDDSSRWFALHGYTDLRPGYLVLNVRCVALDPRGLCSIYEKRPDVCKRFVAGSYPCLEVVRRRRAPEEYALIRETGDPERVHDGQALPLRH